MSGPNVTRLTVGDLPGWLDRELTRRAERRDKTRSRIIVEALAHATGLEDNAEIAQVLETCEEYKLPPPPPLEPVPVGDCDNCGTPLLNGRCPAPYFVCD